MQISHRWHSAAYLTQSTIVLKKIQPQHFFATWPTSPCGAHQCGSCWQNAKKSRKGLMTPKMQGGTLPINTTPMIAVFLLLLGNVVAFAYPLTALGLPEVKHHQTPKVDLVLAVTLADLIIQQANCKCMSILKPRIFQLRRLSWGAPKRVPCLTCLWKASGLETPTKVYHKTVIMGSLLGCLIGTVMLHSQIVL